MKKNKANKSKTKIDNIPEDANIVEVKPQPGIYTVLMLISILFLSAAIYFVGNKLTQPTQTEGPTVGGYGLKLGDMFEPVKSFEKQKAKSIQKAVEKAHN